MTAHINGDSRVAVPRLYTIPEAMQALGLKSRDSVYRLISDGDLNATNVARKDAKRSRMRISEDSLRAFIDKRTGRAS